MSSLLKILLIASTAIFLTSCMHSKIRYIQDKNEIFGQIDEYANHPPEYKLQKEDILYIKVSSTNSEIGNLFAINSSGAVNRGSRGAANSGGFYLDGFTVSDSGNIDIPVVGKLAVEGLTIDQTQVLVQQNIDKLLNDAIVTVKLVSFYVDFLGEMNSQGRLFVQQDNINILDAISQMGGVSTYGDRKNVLVVRKTPTGTKTFRVDLTKRDLLSSDKFYMLPYDMIVVEPLRRKSFRLSVADYSLVLTTISSTITMIFVLLNLSK